MWQRFPPYWFDGQKEKKKGDWWKKKDKASRGKHERLTGVVIYFITHFRQ